MFWIIYKVSFFYMLLHAGFNIFLFVRIQQVCLLRSCILSYINTLRNLIHQPVTYHRINRTKHIRSNTKCHCRRHSEESGCDGQCSEGVKRSLPCVSCGISYADSRLIIPIYGYMDSGSTRYSTINNRHPTTLNNPLFPALDAQSSVNGRHTDMQAIPPT